MQVDTPGMHRFEGPGASISTLTGTGVSGGSFRRRATHRLALVVAWAACCTWPAALAAEAVLPTTITVRVYQNAGLRPVVERRALAEAKALLAAALVDVRWLECTGPNRSSVCAIPPGQSELLLVVRGGTAGEKMAAALGHALVVRRAGGMLATVYLKSVARLARTSRTDATVLLGRVIAHELGHLIMDTPAHARCGLMRASWTPWEIRRNHAADWAFTATDVAAIRRAALE